VKLINLNNLFKSSSSYFLIPLLPILFFGIPPLYGDDYNTIDSLSSMGFLGSLEAWIKAYGLFYRPIGAFIHYGLSYLFYPNIELLYFIALIIYLFIGYLLYQLINKIEGSSSSLSNFVMIFFITFPFNVTAYLQLSSIYFLFSCILMLCSLLLFLSNSINNNYRIILSSLVWCIALLVYEQITGLVLLFFIFQFNLQKEKKLYEKCYNALIRISPIIFITMIFMVLYFSLENNPKIDVVKDYSNNIENVNDVNENEDYYNKKKPKRSFLFRINQLINFYWHNLFYSINSLFSSGFRGSIILLLTMIIVLFTKYKISNHNQLFFSIIGLIWFTVTLMPFLLFRGFHIPVYNLLLPAIGLSIIIYNLITIILKNHNLTYSIIIKVLILSCIINHYGVYFGLKEELSYWENVGNRLIPYKNELLNGKEVMINTLSEKNNHHIFWLEKANGYRHLNNIVGIGNLIITKNSDSSALVFRKNYN